MSFLKVRLPGSGLVETNIVLSPACEQNIVESYPLNEETRSKQCGSMVTIPIIIETPECKENISIPDQCQVSASSMTSPSYHPFKVTFQFLFLKILT